jgi:dTDP-4-amino-4,6-dideoxygalactose transaminase
MVSGCMLNAPATHPVAPLASLLLPRAHVDARAVLDVPGLELTFNGRGALGAAYAECRSSTRTRVLVPAYHCPSAISPAIAAGLEPVFYRIRRDLGIDYDDLLGKADDSCAAVLVIHYFGIAPDLTPLAALQDSGVRLVEDCSHAFLHGSPPRLAGSTASDYRIYSFWKTVPSGVGGGLWRRAPRLGTDGAAERPQARVGVRLRHFKRLLEESVEHSELLLLKSVLSAAERARLAIKSQASRPPAPPPSLESGELYYDTDPHLAASGMPGHARRVLMASDVGAIAERRCANFMRYAVQSRRLKPMRALFNDLPAGSCPWVFPVLLEERPRYDTRLRAAGVPLHSFGTYLHSALFTQGGDAMIADARHLAQQMLCLAIHQDLSTGDIDRAVEIIETGFKHGGPRCH